MAKITLLILFIFFQLTSQAQESFNFIEYDQFLKLTASEQTQYIKSIQDLVIQFDNIKDYAPTVQNTLKWNEFLFHQIFTQAWAQNTESSKIPSSDIREENAKISIRLIFLDSYIQAAKDHPSETLRTSVKDVLLEIHDRLNHLSQKKMTEQQKMYFNKNRDTFSERFNEAKSVSPEISQLKLQLQKQNPQINQTKVTPHTTTQGTHPLPLAPICLYAGFVIFEKSCSPKHELPANDRLQELQNSDFKCKTNNEILCNPLVFGYQNDLSPYCTHRSRTASKNCQEISNNSDNLNRLHSAWKNTANKKVFENYQNSLKLLCQSDHQNLDVKSTCKIVVAQFNDYVKKELPAILTAQEASKSKTKKSLQKN